MEQQHDDVERRKSSIRNLQDLPTLSAVLKKIIEIVEDKHSSAKNLSDVISTDQSILSVILKLVNSAFYGHMRKITSIDQATVILGFNVVKSMALGASIFKVSRKSGVMRRFDRNGLWVHSLGVATTAKTIAEKVGLDDPEEVFVCGLLHDVGKVVFEAVFPDEFFQIITMVEEENKSMIECEKKALGLDHAEAGQILMHKWHLPINVANSIGYHHASDNAPEECTRLASIIHLADIISRTLRIGSGWDERTPDMKRYAMKAIDFTPAIFESVMAETRSKKESMESFAIF
ncbi:MAG: histidine kinase [bacterium]|nr:MAG: histidine kinase [bacterium]